MITNLTLDEWKLVISGLGLLALLLVLLWPREANGTALRISWLILPAVLLGLPAASATVVFTRQAEASALAEGERLKETNLQLLSKANDLQVQVVALKAQVETLNQSASDERKVAAEKAAELKGALEQALIDLSASYNVRDGLIDIQLKEEAVQFRFDSSEIECNSKDNLSRIVGKLSHDLEGIETVTVVGHTDATGEREHPEHNVKLSEARAAAVAKYLVSSGIPQNLFRTEGRSARQPFGVDHELTSLDDILKANQTKEQMARNRRVQFLIQLKQDARRR
jgi:outer membrane protein OmpA-like peptidoglycan-associated protein